MATSLPYVPSNKNLPTLFGKIATAKIPATFTHIFLQKTIGLKGTNDRPFIPLLRTLGFLDASGTPTARYPLLKNSAAAKGAIAAAVLDAYAPLFEANEDASTLSNEQLKGLIAQVAGTDDDMTARILSTFNALKNLGDFAGQNETGEQESETEVEKEAEQSAGEETKKTAKAGLRPDFHYNIQVHLPSNGTEEVYLNIFNALRKAFQ